jgi:hypothetical protein
MRSLLPEGRPASFHNRKQRFMKRLIIWRCLWGFGIISLAFVLEGCAGTGCHKISPQDCPPVEWLANPRTVQLEIVVRVEWRTFCGRGARGGNCPHRNSAPNTAAFSLVVGFARSHGQRGVAVSCEPPRRLFGMIGKQNRISTGISEHRLQKERRSRSAVL